MSTIKTITGWVARDKKNEDPGTDTTFFINKPVLSEDKTAFIVDSDKAESFDWCYLYKMGKMGLRPGQIKKCTLTIEIED